MLTFRDYYHLGYSNLEIIRSLFKTVTFTQAQYQDYLVTACTNHGTPVVKEIIGYCNEIPIEAIRQTVEGGNKNTDLLKLLVKHGAQFDQDTVEWGLQLADPEILDVILDNAPKIRLSTIMEFLNYYTRDRYYALIKIVKFIPLKQATTFKLNKLLNNNDLADYILFRRNLAKTEDLLLDFLWKPDGPICRKNYHDNILFLNNNK